MMTQAAESNSCSSQVEFLRQQVKDCEHVIDAAEIAINKQSNYITEQEQQNQRLMRALDSQTSALASASVWYKQPSIVAPAAFIAGALAIIAAQRH
jgi:hypothetical protein